MPLCTGEVVKPLELNGRKEFNRLAGVALAVDVSREDDEVDLAEEIGGSPHSTTRLTIFSTLSAWVASGLKNDIRAITTCWVHLRPSWVTAASD